MYGSIKRPSAGRSSIWPPARISQDGSLSPQIGIGPTALAALGLLRSGRSPDDPQVAKGGANLTGLRAEERRHLHARQPSRTTRPAWPRSVPEANRDGRYEKLIAAAEKFLKRIQWDEEQGKDKSDRYYGGAGYGGKSSGPTSPTPRS